MSLQIVVPQSMTGINIGKGGQTIRMIEEHSGASIQLKQEDDNRLTRICFITGDVCGHMALHMIRDLIDDTVVRIHIYMRAFSHE